MAEGDTTLLVGSRDKMSVWNKGHLRACRMSQWYPLWLKTDVIGATEIEKSLCGFKLGLDSMVLKKGHEFAEELAAES